jgi:hypothetical protein
MFPNEKSRLLDDASLDQGLVDQGMSRPKDVSSKGRIILDDASLCQGRVDQGMSRPKDVSSKGRIIKGSHWPRDGTSQTFHSRTHRSVTK